ncbi:hypothetical protein L195_g061373 [Trifolium pratense]|uniref:Uncharacterized protein n=1 Tax=Trifolium pratense TaxID=57577 RepID=A0A2K3K9F1_TRIPR|nr:hypothetical protein L195_g061373 [Trifolium pratense]
MRSPAAPCTAFCQQSWAMHSFLSTVLRHAQPTCAMRNSAVLFAGFCVMRRSCCAMRSSQQTGKSTVDLRIDFLIAFAPGTYFTQFFA